jgi:uncharacterized protein
MINADLLKIMCCPETHQPLAPADPETIAKLNQKITATQLRNRRGDAVQEKIEGGLLREDGKYLYPIRNGIPIMLMDEAIPVSATDKISG